MTKIKTLLKDFTQHFTQTAVRFPITIVLIGLTSLTLSLFIDQSGSLGRFMEDRAIPFLLLWGIGTYFAETFWRSEKMPKLCGILAAGFIAGLLVYFDSTSSGRVKETISHWQMAYVIVLITLGIYRNYKYAGLPFAQYCIHVVHELSRLAIVCAIVGLGIALIMAVFVTLILNGKHYMLIIRAEFLVLGCLTGSGLLYAQIQTDRELPHFFVMIVKYLLPTLLLAAFAIIYGYILKIIITREVPSNEIFRILAGLFLIGMPIWTLAGIFKEQNLLGRISACLPYIFIPFLFLQGYAIRARILGFGLTPLRYLCLALMAFEIIYIAVYALRKGETAVMLPVIAGMALICLVLPGVNMYSVANRSQKVIFDRYIAYEFSDLSAEAQSDLAGAYYYLMGNEEGKAMLVDTDPVKIEAIKSSGKTGRGEYSHNLYIYDDFPVLNQDISDFSSMTMVQTANSERDDDSVPNPEAISFVDTEGKPAFTANLSEFLNLCISGYQTNGSDTSDIPALISLEEGDQIRITHCNLVVGDDNSISRLDIAGIWLKNGDAEADWKE